MSPGLRAFGAADFNWTRDLQSVWSDPVFQVDELNKTTVDRIMDDFLLRTKTPTDNPVGRVVLGEAGAGKTHLIGTLRRRVWQARGWFVLLDIIGINDFWATAALGFVNSLHQQMASGQTQYQTMLIEITRQARVDAATKKAIVEWNAKPDKTRLDIVDLFLRLLRGIDQVGAKKNQDVIRALLLLDSDDADASNLAYCWLQGLDVDESKRRSLKFLAAPPPHPELVRGMLWVMSLAGPTLIAVDQIDSIVSASNMLVGVDEAHSDDSERKARHIIGTLAGGLMDLHDLKRRAMTVVSCLQVTWPIIKERAVKSVEHRFEQLPVLAPIKSRDIVENVIGDRLDRAYAEAGFRPPYRTWPFRPEAIDSAVGLLPRAILIRCRDHQQLCIAAGEVLECGSLEQAAATTLASSPAAGLDQEFTRQLRAADISALQDKDNEDTTTCDLLIQVCELFLKQLSLPDAIDAIVQPDPDRKKPSLHARLSFTFHDQGDREKQYCLRGLFQTNAIAFQWRLKAAMTASGIDTALKFRHLFILRRGDPPGGPKTKDLVDQFTKAGGKFIAPTDEDLRAFVALKAMADRDLPGFEAWLRGRKPLFDTALFKAMDLCPPAFLSPSSPAPPSRAPHAAEPASARTGQKRAQESDGVVGDGGSDTTGPRDFGPATQPTPAHRVETPATPRAIPIGRRFERGVLGDPVTLAADMLPRHVAILAGSGSGKTVLLRRIVEEAALLGIPAIVLDVNNDLSRLGDTWPTPPDGLSEEDHGKAAAYGARADVVIWTPGVTSGNPISLNLLPDFAAIGGKPDAQTEDERGQAVEMARATLAPYLGATGSKAGLKQGVLADALRAFAKSGGGPLDELIRLLCELPENISQIGEEAKGR